MAVDGEMRGERWTERLAGIRPRLPRAGLPGAPATPEADTRVPAVNVVEAKGLRWIHIERTRLAEREWLSEHFDFHPLAFEDLVSRNQRPKVDIYDDYLFIVLYFPSFEKATGRLKAVEIDLFVGPDYVITLPNERFVPLTRQFNRVEENEEVRDQLFSYGSGYLLYRIVDESVDAGFPMLRQMGGKLDDIEDALFEGRALELVRDISGAKSEIINYRRIVRPQRVVYRDLEKAVTRYRAPDLDLYFDDITDASERIWDVLENYKEQVESHEVTNESVISHRMNDALRVLTALSVILLPQTFVASVFGMNVLFPGEGTVEGWWVIFFAMVGLTVLLIAWFRRNNWI